MTLADVFSDLRTAIAVPSAGVDGAAIDVPSLVAGWLDRGPAVFAPHTADGDALDALCRQIDVRGRVSEAYGPDWRRLDPEAPAAAPVVAGVVAVLLANAADVGPRGNDGWGLKCANSALKALDRWPDLPELSGLRLAVMTVLDHVSDRAGAA